MNYQQQYKLSDSVMKEGIDDEVMLMDTQTQLFFQLNTTGSLLWDVLQEHNTLGDVHTQMMEMFEVETEQLENDIENFVQSLVQHEMLSFVE